MNIQTRSAYGWMLLPIIVVMMVYGTVVNLPFFSDDIIHFRGTSQTTPTEILTQVQVGAYYLNYYRPVVNLVLYAAWELGLTPSAPVWHAIILLNHILNMVLLGEVLRQLGFSKTVQGVAVLIFGLFPFNYQVVIWVLAWFHTLALTAVLLCSLAALHYFRQPQKYGWLALAWIAGGIAPFIHENGVLASLITLILLAYTHHKNILKPRMVLILFPVFLVTMVYIILWDRFAHVGLLNRVLNHLQFFPSLMLLPLTGVVVGHQRQTAEILSPHFHPSVKAKWILVAILLATPLILYNLRGTGLWTNYSPRIAYFLQGISFPVQIGLEKIVHLENAKLSVFLGGSLLAGLVAALVYQEDTHFQKGIGLALVWLALATLPALLWLDNGYILSSPRLFYASSPAIGLFYGILFEWGFSKRRFLATLLLTLTLISSITYIHNRITLHQTLGSAYTELFATLPEDPTTSIIIVNAPRWLAPEGNYFPMENMGAVFVPDYFPLEDFIWLNTGREYLQLNYVTHPATQYWQHRTTPIGNIVTTDTIPANQQVYHFRLMQKQLRVAHLNNSNQN